MALQLDIIFCAVYHLSLPYKFSLPYQSPTKPTLAKMLKSGVTSNDTIHFTALHFPSSFTADSFIVHNTDVLRAALKVISSMLCWPTMSEEDVSGTVIKVEPFHQYSIPSCCRETDGSSEVQMKQRCAF